MSNSGQPFIEVLYFFIAAGNDFFSFTVYKSPQRVLAYCQEPVVKYADFIVYGIDGQAAQRIDQPIFWGRFIDADYLLIGILQEVDIVIGARDDFLPLSVDYTP